MSRYLGFLRLSPCQSSLPLVPPCHLPAPSLPNFYITVPGLPGAGPPMPGSARSRRREERQRETRGSRAGPAAETAPPPGPPPDPPPAPNPPFHTLQGRSPSGCTAPRHKPGVGVMGAAEYMRELGEGLRGSGDLVSARPHFGASTSRRLSPPAGPGDAGCSVQGPGRMKRGAARSSALQRQPEASTRAHPVCARRSRAAHPAWARTRLRLRGPECSEATRPAEGAAFRAEGS